MNELSIAAERMDRRRFLAGLGTAIGTSALTGSAVAAVLNADAGMNAAGIPMRVLGRTKEKVTTFGLGSACVGHSMPGAGVGVPVYRAALEAGVNLVDTARGYDDAEGYLGELMPQWRDKIFLTTKAMPDGDSAESVSVNVPSVFTPALIFSGGTMIGGTSACGTSQIFFPDSALRQIRVGPGLRSVSPSIV